MDNRSLHRHPPTAVYRRPLAGVCVFLIALSLLGAAVEQAPPPDGPAAAPPRGAGRLIRVPLPVTNTVASSVRRMIHGVVEQFREAGQLDGQSRPVLILELDPGRTEFGAGSQFGAAVSLAEVLTSRDLAPVKTVAYLPRPIRGHGVLVAMACEEIVMAPDAEIGQAGIDVPSGAPIGQAVRDFYRQIANLRRTIPVAVALGMLDKDLEVHKVETEVSVEFVLAQNLADLRQKLTIQSDEVLIDAGELGSFTGRAARELGFAKYLAVDRDAVARALQLPAGAVDPMVGWVIEPRQFRLEGPITGPSVGRLQRMIEDQLRSGEVNLVCLRIDSAGGGLADSLTLANYLASLDRSAVRTVAYVASQARGDAALVALACDHLIMKPQAMLGGAGPQPLTREEIDAARTPIRDVLALRKATSWSPLAAMIDPELEVFEYRNRGTGETRYFSPDEAAAQEAPDAWQQGEKITQDHTPLELDGARAHQFGLARQLVDSFDELKQLYGLQDDPRMVEPGWADFLVHALASPGVAMLLLLIGGAGLYAEVNMPGIGIGGFIAGVAFLLFFWSKFLDGTSDWLEVTLFLGGLCFLLLEIFVIPGFGIFGLGGGLMIIVSLVLASQTFIIPKSPTQLAQLRGSMLVVAGAAVGIVALAVFVRRYGPRAPVLNRLMLKPMQGEELASLVSREAIADFRHLLGDRGVTTTQLTPSGKARFAAELVDVIADGEVIDRGRQVVVVDVHGNQVTVQEVPPQ
jgi:membrane-bound serine protease (ClpP class)